MSQQGSQPATRAEGPDLGERIRLAVGIIAALALALFLLQNLQRAEVHFLWFDWTTRMIWALLLSAAFGAAAALAVFVLLPRFRRPRGQTRQ